ncbi:hypothetical protein [Gilvibacter sediminis]|uniref:hypothetical protein n=1 Tax=Gilvibacter sediminis TaxID=379071 RepID=UPI002350A67E|nr:hypothetical protein [Gilvibacter sediminis]MDC7998581.1 hypothetical protein [Gilvibacter sediminis]
MGPNNSRRNFLRTTAAASVGLSLIGTATLANTDTLNDFPGYSSISDSKTDFRAGLKLGKYLNIKGQILDGTTLLPVANAKVEVWFKDANSNWKLKRGYFHTDANGDYSFKSDWPGRKEGELPRFYFRISKNGRENYGLLCVNQNFAHAHASHWAKHNVLGDKTLPTTSHGLTNNTINLNFSL